VYAEAYVTVHQYDIVLDVTVINRTSETLQNLCLELATMGDLKLVERPQNYTLSPQSSKTIRCTLCTAGCHLLQVYWAFSRLSKDLASRLACMPRMYDHANPVSEAADLLQALPMASEYMIIKVFFSLFDCFLLKYRAMDAKLPHKSCEDIRPKLQCS